MSKLWPTHNIWTLCEKKSILRQNLFSKAFENDCIKVRSFWKTCIAHFLGCSQSLLENQLKCIKQLASQICTKIVSYKNYFRFRIDFHMIWFFKKALHFSPIWETCRKKIIYRINYVCILFPGLKTVINAWYLSCPISKSLW